MAVTGCAGRGVVSFIVYCLLMNNEQQVDTPHNSSSQSFKTHETHLS